MDRERLNTAKELQFERLTIDGVVCQGPAVLFNADLVGAAGGASTAIVFDGNSTAGRVMINLAAVTSTADRAPYNQGLFFPRGIYVDVGANVTSVSFLFIPIKE